jgi:hypothetical protein
MILLKQRVDELSEEFEIIKQYVDYYEDIKSSIFSDYVSIYFQLIDNMTYQQCSSSFAVFFDGFKKDSMSKMKLSLKLNYIAMLFWMDKHMKCAELYELIDLRPRPTLKFKIITAILNNIDKQICPTFFLQFIDGIKTSDKTNVIKHEFDSIDDKYDILQEIGIEESHPKHKKPKLSKRLRTECWFFHVGKDKGSARCFCCNGREITQSEFEVGHVQSVFCGGDNNLKNLRPICVPCNRSMGTKDMREFMMECGFGELREHCFSDFCYKH